MGLGRKKGQGAGRGKGLGSEPGKRKGQGLRAGHGKEQGPAPAAATPRGRSVPGAVGLGQAPGTGWVPLNRAPRCPVTAHTVPVIPQEGEGVGQLEAQAPRRAGNPFPPAGAHAEP